MTKSVEALWLTESGPRMMRGSLDSSEAGLILTITDDELPPVGSRLLLYGDSIQMLSTRVTSTQAQTLELEPESRPTDKRLHPRLFGNIPTRLQPVKDIHIADWLSGHLSIEDGWLKPEPFMNFSVNGLSFEIEASLEQGVDCIVEFSVGDLTDKHRACATVIRSIDIGNAVEVALHFYQLPPKAKQQLSEFTLSIQEALLHK